MNVQNGISPYRVENQSKINKSYMYDYLRPKSSHAECNPVDVMLGAMLNSHVEQPC